MLPGSPGNFEAAQQVVLLEKPTHLDRSEGDIHGDGNPHIQLDPRRILKVAKSLSAILQSLDPTNLTFYQERLDEFTGLMEKSIPQWQKKIIFLQGKQVIVHHKEWTYLLDWLGMQQIGSLEPKPGIPPTMDHLAKLKQQPAELIIISPLNNKNPSNWLNKQTGIPIVVLPHTVGAVANTDNFIDFFDEIISRLTSRGSL